MHVNGEDKTRAKDVNPVLPKEDPKKKIWGCHLQLSLRALPGEDAEDSGSKSFTPFPAACAEEEKLLLLSPCLPLLKK